jgi:hypothetical protein
MINKYGSEEAWKAAMREFGMKGRKTGRGGFYHLKHVLKDEDKLTDISRKGGWSRGHGTEYRSTESE